MNKPNKAELEYFIRYSLDSDKYKRYMELYDEIERLKEENTMLKAYIEQLKQYIIIADIGEWLNLEELINKEEE